MKGELHLRFTQADVWARSARAAIAQPAPEPRPRLPASTCPFCACVWQRHSAGEPHADTLHAGVVGRGPCAGGGGIPPSWGFARLGCSAPLPRPGGPAPLSASGRATATSPEWHYATSVLLGCRPAGSLISSQMAGAFFFFLRLNTTQLYVSKPVPLSIVCGWTVGVASASWPR